MPTFTNHHLTAEHINDQHGHAIMLTQQEDINDPCTIVMHPWQLVAACQHLGLNNSDPRGEKTIATLTRRLLGLRDRIESLSEWMAKHSDHEHADLSYETTQLNAMADLVIEWCRDFDEPESEGHRVTRSEPEPGDLL